MGLQQVDLAVQMGDRYGRTMLSMVETGQRKLSLSRATAAARALGVSLDYLVGLTNNPRPVDRLNSEPVPNLAADYVVAPWAQDVRAAAGAALPVFDEAAAEFGVALHRSILPDWVRHDRLICISAAGDSMHPTLRDGDLVALDHSRTDPLDGQIFVVRAEAGLVIKRLRGRPGGPWRLTSDNPLHPPRPVTAAHRIVGRVAWSGPPRN